MAKPLPRLAALKLVEMGVEVSDNVITALSSGAEAIDLEGSDVGGGLKKLEVGRVLSWFEERVTERLKDFEGSCPRRAELKAASVDVGEDQWTPIRPSPGDQETGRRDGVLQLGENAWAGHRPAQGDAPRSSIRNGASTHPDIRKNLKYFYVSGGGARSIGPLVLSKAPAAIKLVELLLAKAPSTLVPSAIVTASTPKTAATALKLLEAYPTAVLDAVSIEPLLAKDGARLQKLLFDESKESSTSIQLIDALCAKSEAVGNAVTAPEMLRAALTLAAARLIVRFLDVNGDDALVAALGRS